MAGTSLLALIDDIATLLDDIGVLTKTAASKTAGVLGDDLALNAEQVSGVRPERELPVVWAVAKGSALNKLILVPVALALSAFLPWMVSKLLMAGGAYLCFEGCEKVVHSLWGKSDHEVEQKELRQHLAAGDLVDYEKKKIKGAILTDFILSAEIVVITLGTVRQSPLVTQAIVMTLVAAVLTVGVYAIVAAIVKLDDLGLALAQYDEVGIARRAGRWILWFAPRLLKILGVLGTVAMFLVGGGIWVHGVGPLAHLAHGAEHTVGSLPHVGTMLDSLTVAVINLTTGALLGAATLGVWTLLRFSFRRPDAG